MFCEHFKYTVFQIRLMIVFEKNLLKLKQILEI